MLDNAEWLTKLNWIEMLRDVGRHFSVNRMLYGNEIVEADNVTFKKDAKNPDPALRARSLKNIVFIAGLRWEDGEWGGGTIYDASSGRTYNCKATVKDGKMHLRGYLGLPAMGQTRTFHRARG